MFIIRQQVGLKFVFSFRNGGLQRVIDKLEKPKRDLVNLNSEFG